MSWNQWSYPYPMMPNYFAPPFFNQMTVPPPPIINEPQPQFAVPTPAKEQSKPNEMRLMGTATGEISQKNAITTTGSKRQQKRCKRNHTETGTNTTSIHQVNSMTPHNSSLHNKPIKKRSRRKAKPNMGVKPAFNRGEQPTTVESTESNPIRQHKPNLFRNVHVQHRNQNYRISSRQDEQQKQQLVVATMAIALALQSGVAAPDGIELD